jgi:hypothetical protein
MEPYVLLAQLDVLLAILLKPAFHVLVITILMELNVYNVLQIAKPA